MSIIITNCCFLCTDLFSKEQIDFIVCDRTTIILTLFILIIDEDSLNYLDNKKDDLKFGNNFGELIQKWRWNLTRSQISLSKCYISKISLMIMTSVNPILIEDIVMLPTHPVVILCHPKTPIKSDKNMLIYIRNISFEVVYSFNIFFTTLHEGLKVWKKGCWIFISKLLIWMQDQIILNMKSGKNFIFFKL